MNNLDKLKEQLLKAKELVNSEDLTKYDFKAIMEQKKKEKERIAAENKKNNAGTKRRYGIEDKAPSKLDTSKDSPEAIKNTPPLPKDSNKKINTDKLDNMELKQYTKRDKTPAELKADQKPSLKVVKEEVTFNKSGQWSLDKSNYGPKQMKLYSQTDNAQRKNRNVGESFENVGQNKNAKPYTTSGSSMQQQHEKVQAKEYKKKAKASTRTLSPEELKAFAAQRSMGVSKEEMNKAKQDGKDFNFNQQVYHKESKTPLKISHHLGGGYYACNQANNETAVVHKDNLMSKEETVSENFGGKMV